MDPGYTFVLILGKARSGKTTLEEQYLRAAIESGRAVKIVDNKSQFPPGSLPGGYCSEFPGVDNIEDWLADLLHSQWEGDLCFDDMDLYSDSFVRKGSPFRVLFTEYRHHRISIRASTRRFQEIPTLARTNTTHYALFRTEGHNMREAIKRELGQETLAKVPTKPFRYLLLDRDADTAVVYATRARATKTRADF
jgi:hypothetical protein